MPSKNPSQRLHDIIDNIEAIEAFTAHLDFPGFRIDQKTVYAVVRALEIVSEASRRLPDELKDRAGRNVIEVRPRSAGELPAVEQTLARIGCEPPFTDMDTQRVSVRVEGGGEQLRDVVRLLDERAIAVDDVGLRRPSLDEVFLSVTGKHIDPSDPDSDPQSTAADAA